MPVYEYRCEACSRTFTVQMSMSDHDRADAENVVCPVCHKAPSVPQYSAFFARTSRKS